MCVQGVNPNAGALPTGRSDGRKTGFPPVVSATTQLLILGSLPGDRSIAQAQYYAHPQNQFWHLIGAVIGVRLLDMDYPDRLAALLQHHVGLWDVVQSAHRPGSLDSALRETHHNKLVELVARLPALRAIAFNGKAAGKIGLKLLAGVKSVPHYILPSSSPAYTLSLAQKQVKWDALKETMAMESNAMMSQDVKDCAATCPMP